MPKRASTECDGVAEATQTGAFPGTARALVRAIPRAAAGSTVLLSATGFRGIDMASRAQTCQPASKQFVHLFLGEQILNSAKDLGQRRGTAACLLHFGQQLIVVIALHRVLINLDRRTQPVFDELHQLHLVTQAFLERGLSQSVALQRGVPSLIGGAFW